MTNEQKPEQAKRGRKPIPDHLKKSKRTIYVTDREYYEIRELLEKKRYSDNHGA